MERGNKKKSTRAVTTRHTATDTATYSFLPEGKIKMSVSGLRSNFNFTGGVQL